MRAFIAIEFPREIKDAYAAGLEKLERRHPVLRWVQPGCVHLTLRFLGEVGETLALGLRAPVAAVAADVAPFRISLGEPGTFGSTHAPGIFWIAVDEGRRTLEKLQPRLEAIAAASGFAAENNAWKPHVTLARKARRGRKRSTPVDGKLWRELIVASGLVGMWFEVSELSLFSSELTPRGPVYSTVWTAALAAT